MSLDDLAAKLRAARRRRGAAAHPGDGARAIFEPSSARPTKGDRGATPEGAAADLVSSSESSTAPMILEDQVVLSAAAKESFDALQSSHRAEYARLCRLDAQQLEVVLADDQAAIVEAQVGSGKTTVLVEKIRYLQAVRGVSPDRIAVLTFTNKAAREIRQRLEEAGSGQRPSETEPWIGTFHSIARRLLAEVIPAEGGTAGRRFTVLPSERKRRMLEELRRESGLRICYAKQLERRLEKLEAGVVRHGNMKRDDDLAELAELYKKSKKRAGLLDFDDLIREALDGLHRLGVDRRPDWIIVDEFQDSDPRQIEFIAKLGHAKSRYLAVGDPRQVIYSWRGSRPEVFTEFEKAFSARTYDLSCNYRSRATILEAAACILGAYAGTMRPRREAGDALGVRRHHDALQESLYLASKIREHEEDGTALTEIAVLARTRSQVETLSEHLRRADIPVATTGGGKVAESRAVNWVGGLFRAAANPKDLDAWLDLALDRDFGPVDARRIGGRKALASALRRDAESWEGALESSAALFPDEGNRTAYLDFARATLAFAGDLNQGLLAGDADSIFRHWDLGRRLKPTSSRFDENKRLARALIERWCLHRQRSLGRIPAEKSLESFASELVLDEGWQRELGAEEAARDGVALMTLHAAKGLEFDHVFISGVNRGLIPLAAVRTREADLEERRLLFVGITRARESVELSWIGNPESFSGIGEPSPYLDLIPARLLRRDDRRAAEVTDSKEPESAGRRQEKEAGGAWCVGDQVRHAQYGVGVVTEVSDGNVVCRFERFGKKKFSEFFCPLEKCGEQGS